MPPFDVSAAALPRPGRWLAFGVAFVAGLALDVATKRWAFARLPMPGDSRVVIEGWFDLTHAANEGAAFGLLQGQWGLFLAMALLAFAAVPYFVHTAPAMRRGVVVSAVLGLVLAGVAGNFGDRAACGFVRDFLDVHTPGGWRWYTFNLADVWIVCGGIGLAVWAGNERQPLPAAA